MKKYSPKLIYIYLILLFSVLNFYCSPTRNLEKGKYIVDDVKIKIDNKDFSKKKIKSLVKPKPLTKILGLIAFRSRIYNIPDSRKDKIREIRKKEKLLAKNIIRDKKFDKETEKLQRKRNIYFNKKERLLAEADTIGYLEANIKYEELKNKVDYRKTHAAELKESNRKEDVFMWYEFIRRIGQKPEVFDMNSLNNSKKQIEIYLKNQGYFNYTVQCDTKIVSKKRVDIIVNIKTGTPIKIGSVSYNFPKSEELVSLFNNHNIRIPVGKKFDVEALEEFRNNLSNYYREKGFYFFSSQLISYKIDTIGRYSNAALFVNFNQSVDKKVYEKWKIKDIYIFTDYDPNLALQYPIEYFSSFDTTDFITTDNKLYYFIKKSREDIKQKHIVNELYIFKDSTFSLSSSRNTYSHLSKFKIYKLTNIQFEEVADSTQNYLDCKIQLTPSEKMGYNFNIESTHTSESVGAAAYTNFSHKNLFRGGEMFDMKLQLALEHQKSKDTIPTAFFNTQEYSFDLKCAIPRLLIPFISNSFVKRNNPKTTISTFFSYQDRLEYNKLESTLSLEYFFKSSDLSNHIVTPLRFSFVRVPEMSEEFFQWVQRSQLIESYEDHFIIGSRYSLSYSNQGKTGNNFFFMFNFSPAGNSLYGIAKIFNKEDSLFVVPIFKTPFAQFVKADFDFRYYNKSNENHQLIFRLFAGAGYPYGNSTLIPFGEKYFIGGANSLRAWEARSLGPGVYKKPSDILFSNQTADIKIEMNLEYRFNIIKYLEGALFVDAGNIWAINSYDTRIGSLFKFNEFYNQFAVGTGAGIRLNVGFFVFRTDLGIKIYDPAAIAGNFFIPLTRKFNYSDFVLNIAIGYPF